jgi:superfamily II DNA helicase RecQ
MQLDDAELRKKLQELHSEVFSTSTTTALFRGAQQELCLKIVQGKKDLVIVLPPNSGKSRVFQVAGLYKNGLTVVIQPLLALQVDQVREC